MYVFHVSNIECCVVVGVGKTALIKKTCDALKSREIPVQGFYTQECRQGSHRIGFDVVTLSGDRQPLARLELVSACLHQSLCCKVILRLFKKLH